MKSKIALLIVALIILIFSTHGYLFPSKQAYDKHSPEDLLQLASKGIADAQCELGRRYYHGIGLEKDDRTALSWIYKAANQNHPDGHYLLANFYNLGLGGLDIDLDQAFKLYLLSAEAGHPPAQSSVGICYDIGQGVKTNKELARYWYAKAANNRDVRGISNLAATEYNLGFNSNKKEHFTEALKWALVGVEKNDAGCMCILGRCHYFGSGLECDINKAISWFEKAINLGNSEAKIYMGRCLSLHSEVNVDLKKAEYWLKLAIEDGLINAHYFLGHVYLKQSRFADAYTEFKSGADAGDQHAGSEYAICLRDGRGCTENVVAAFTTMRIWAESGDPTSERLLGAMYSDGVGVEVSESDAAIWYGKAAERGERIAQLLLAKCLINGDGIAMDRDRGFRMIKQLAESGYDDAVAKLAECHEKGFGTAIDISSAISLLTKDFEAGNYANSLYLVKLQFRAKRENELMETLLTLSKAGNQKAIEMLFDLLEDNRFSQSVLDQRKGDNYLASAINRLQRERTSAGRLLEIERNSKQKLKDMEIRNREDYRRQRFK